MHNEDWYALQVYTGKEKWVASMLDDRGHEVLLLLYTVVQTWSDRRKRIDRPVFPGYIFCHFDPHRRSPILATPGVLKIVSVGRTPLPVSHQEIETMMRIADAGVAAAPVPYLRTGESVIIRGGSLDGTIGRVMAFRKGLRVIVSITLLERSVCLEVDHERLERLPANESSPILPLSPGPIELFYPEAKAFLPVKRFKARPSPIKRSASTARVSAAS
jgi:transcription antitermination factor NusG